ncbi:MAG TPA: glucose-6-phosphate dehydrogenase [Xanthobacteraceae bacterium]|nr:glucose-6-phosphate dehydrogenase [Xanthobacteraceae bacterium]
MESRAQRAGPCGLVIFGAAGDLTQRLLVPALYNLRRGGLLAEEFAIVGIARSAKDSETFRRDLGASLRAFDKEIAEDDWKWLADRMFYLEGEFDDPAAYKELVDLLAKVDERHGSGGNYLFYLATPPQVFATIIGRLGEAGLVRESETRWRRVIIEKPFGTDLRSAQALNRKTLAVLNETQIYRIDHYLGKETVQNMLVFRFGNGIFEPLWNRNHIDHVQITVAEALGVERRGKFYEETGALRDMVPNHLFQLLTLVAMEPPTCFAPEAVRSEKTKLLDAVHPFGPDDARRNVVRGQYGAGNVGGQSVTPYRCAPNVAPGSTTETYVALKLMVDNWRWAGVPIYLRTGKALARRRSEVVIRFKQAPFALFRDTPVERLTPNDLILHIQPEEGVTLRFGAKVPGPRMRMGDVEMKFSYRDYFNAAPSTGYETLIYDCMLGDATLFKRADDIEAGWRIVQPLLDAWRERDAPAPEIYPAGSSGPDEADALMARDGRHWRALDASNGAKSP